eukprot:TRINITY_DN27530_c0_g1_i1.p1 TRINITY_DN27530_c0_g1~~TRINITY_DN27530_c0_g1_i1.p1  ORF type:complete len:104 (+),score=15.31 TRINITY_DN27530_c0_g1_i1:198-509(+)
MHRKQLELVKEKQIDYILAVGGGSVIDGSKFIAAAAQYDGEPWDILAKGGEIKSAIALGVVRTLPATGSESNSFSVVSNLESHDKLPLPAHLCNPSLQYSILL